LPRTQNLSRATLEASYEIDLWGRYRRADEAARAELLAAESARSALRLSLAAQVAQQYFALLAADGQQAVLERTLALRAETRELSRRRVEAGSAAPAEFRLAEAEEAAVAAQLSEARQARERLEGALALLAGRAPRAVLAPSVPRGRPVVAGLPAIPPGLPSELLLRRPDLAESEARLIAAQARIGVARAQYFPSLALTALLGSESVALRNLFTGPAGIFQFAAAASQPIWNAGRITHGVEAAEARRDEALARYRHAVAAAFGDVRDALSADAAARARLAAETARVRALDDALRQARLRQASGAAGRLEVLDAERQRLAAELARIEAERASRAAVADLVKALGGGWAPAA
jgi:multidrug efflux system outer membrane protein